MEVKLGCGCGKKGITQQFRKRVGAPTVGPRSIQGGAGAPPAQLRALGLRTTAVTAAENRTLDEKRRQLEKERRAALKKRFNK